MRGGEEPRRNTEDWDAYHKWERPSMRGGEEPRRNILAASLPIAPGCSFNEGRGRTPP